MSVYLQSLAGSPLVREPFLAFRKIGKRLGIAPSAGLRKAPVDLRLSYPFDWDQKLRLYFSACGISGEPLPSTKVFGKVFDRALLLEILCNGPRHSAQLDGDVKLAWDFSRSHHFPVNSFLLGESVAPQLLVEMQELMASPAQSLFWSCPMDVAIRAVNWMAADALLGGALGRSTHFEDWAWQHLDVIWRGLEAFRVSGNHYLANLLGLLVLGRSFSGDSLAKKCLAFARRELPRALLAQTYDDGGVYEASLRYHALVTEMALLARLFDDDEWPPSALNRLRLMVQVVADHLDADGDVFPVGDDDNGRVIAPDFSSCKGRGECLLELAAQIFGERFLPRETALYPQSGWWTKRYGDWHSHLEFGGVGMRGTGAHAHDDDLAVCLSFRGQPVLVDPGSYIYTPDSSARDCFRAACNHSTIRLMPKNTEPLALKSENIFIWKGRIEPLNAESTSRGLLVKAGNIRREVKLTEAGFVVTDSISPGASSTAWWFFHLHPDVAYILQDGRAVLSVRGMKFALVVKPSLVITAVQSKFALCYGTCAPSTILCAKLDLSVATQVSWNVTAQ
jgi:hypothetical protein